LGASPKERKGSAPERGGLFPREGKNNRAPTRTLLRFGGAVFAMGQYPSQGATVPT